MARSLFIWITGVACFIALAWWCIAHHAPIIQTDILSRVTQALEQATLANAQIISSVDGLDVTLTGTAATAATRQRAEQITAQVNGVRTVQNNITLSTAGASVVTKPAADIQQTFSAAYDGRQLVLSGPIKNNSTRASVVGIARQAFGSKPVIDHLYLESTVPLSWSAVIKISLLQLANFRTGKLDVRDASLSIVGSVATNEIKEEAIQRIKGVLVSDFRSRFDISVMASIQTVIENCQLEIDRRLNNKVIRFDTGSAIISIDSYPLLDELATTINNCAGVAIEVQGHTDSAGQAESNLRLSENRARAVHRYLTDEGVDPLTLSAKGYGELQPIASNDTSSGRARNRRIEFATLGN